MKFPPKHHNAILKVIYEQGHTSDDFNFIKRKGWVHVYYQPTQEFFAYFLKKETHLDPGTKKWINSSYFKVKKSSGMALHVPDMNALIREFEDWIVTLFPL